jgi:hypothetical protein
VHNTAARSWHLKVLSSPVTRCLPRCCTPVTYGRSAMCSLMVMQQIKTDKDNGLQGGRYARTEDELYKKALALLEKCRIETQSSGQEMVRSHVSRI